jgi:hypothetical protein
MSGGPKRGATIDVSVSIAGNSVNPSSRGPLWLRSQFLRSVFSLKSICALLGNKMNRSRNGVELIIAKYKINTPSAKIRLDVTTLSIGGFVKELRLP